MKQQKFQAIKIAAILVCVAALAPSGPLVVWPAQGQSPSQEHDTEPGTAPVPMPGSAVKAPKATKDAPLKLFDDKTDAASDLTLTVLRDCGLSLNQIRQQAINIFLEATRKSCNGSSKFEIFVPNAISDKDIEGSSSKSKYLEPRAQWLVYYVGTVEPVISLFTQDVRDTRAGATKLLVPEDTKAKILPLWHEWAEGIDGINKELTEINNLIGDGKPENTALAKHAVAMFKYTENLERTRQKAFAAIRHSEKRNSDGTKVNINSSL